METQTTKRYQERLTPDNAAILLIDHQVGLFTGVRDIPVAELTHNVVALAKAAKVLGVPTNRDRYLAGDVGSNYSGADRSPARG